MTAYEINGKEYAVEYDLDNRIIKVEVNNSDVEYRYDAFGRRIIRQKGSTKSALIWWGNSECAEHKHQAGQTVIQNDIMAHPSRLNSVIARAKDGSKFKLEWYHKNYLDHVYAVSDDDGDLLEHYRYSAFGQVTIYNENGVLQNTTQIDNHILWNTRRRDEVTGFYMYKFRHYSAELGRWPSRDPIEEKGGINLYAFVRNDGINRWDKLGLLDIPNPEDYDTYLEALNGARDLVGNLTKESRTRGINQFKTWYDHTNANVTAEFIYNDIHDDIFTGIFESDFQVYSLPSYVNGKLDAIKPVSEGIGMIFGVEYAVQVFKCKCEEEEDRGFYFALNNLNRGEFPNQGSYLRGALGLVSNNLAARPQEDCIDGKLVALVHSHNMGTGSYLGNDIKRNNVGLGLDFMFFNAPTRTENISAGDQNVANIFDVPNFWVDETEGGLLYLGGAAVPQN